MKCKKNTKAMTLAEVLVTLLIIGVLAALTVPQLLQSTNDQQLKKLAKKTFLDLQNATATLASNQGNSIDFSTIDAAAAQYASVMNSVRQGGAWEDFFPTSYKYYKSTSGFTVATGTWDGVLILTNGVAIDFDVVWPNCNGTFDTFTNYCAKIVVDVNGKKEPNMIGRDYINFAVLKTNGEYELMPLGVTGDGWTCTAGSVAMTTSRGCSAIAVSDEAMP